MAVTLQIMPGTVITPEELELRFPEGYAFAADGIVSEKSYIKRPGPYANEDHHYNADRSKLDCAASQTVEDIRAGNFDCFVKDGEFYANLILNHVDMDGLTTYEAAKRFSEIRDGTIDSSFYRFLVLENTLDTTAGFCGLDPESSDMEELAWVSEPTLTLSNGKLKLVGEAGWTKAIWEVGTRFSDYLAGKPRRIKVDTSYAPSFEEIINGKKIVLVENPGPYAPLTMYREGVDVYVIVRENGGNGNRKATIGKTSPSIAYSVERACHNLNLEEGKKDHSGDCWDGSNIVSGSSMRTGTSLESEEIFKIAAKLC